MAEHLLQKLATMKDRQNHAEIDSDFINDINADDRYRVPLRGHLLLWITFAFVIAAITWAHFATLDEVTRGSGKIIPSSHTQIVQNLEGGILADILVKEGELVEKGQALLQLDEIRFASSLNEAKVKRYELLATTARLTAETTNQPLKIPQEVTDNAPSLAEHARSLYSARQSELKANSSVLEQQIVQKNQELVELKSKQDQIARSYQMLKKELDMSEPLVAQGAMSEVELLRLKRNANDLMGDLNAAKLSIPRIEAYITEIKNKLNELKIRFHTDALKELNEAKSQLDQSTESAAALKDRVNRTKVVSPVKGTVKQLKISTVGGVVQPGMDLIEIVPVEDQLLVEANIRPADIAFLRPGQKAMVKLTAYDFSIYGGLEAELEHISADTLIDKTDDNKSYYQIRLRTHKSYLEKNGEKLNIIAGMTADVDILTGKKTVLDYLLKPILKARALALRER